MGMGSLRSTADWRALYPHWESLLKTTLYSSLTHHQWWNLCKILIELWMEINVGIFPNLTETSPRQVHVVINAKIPIFVLVRQHTAVLLGVQCVRLISNLLVFQRCFPHFSKVSRYHAHKSQCIWWRKYEPIEQMFQAVWANSTIPHRGIIHVRRRTKKLNKLYLWL